MLRQVREDLAATHLESAAAQRAAFGPVSDRLSPLRAALQDLLTVREEFGDTAAAEQVPQAVTDTVAAALATVPAEDPCAALPLLDHVVTLPAAIGDTVATAGADRVQRRLDCGLARFGAGEHDGAAEVFDLLLAESPDSPQAAQARSGATAARVADALGRPIPFPAPAAGDEPGANPVTIYNDSTYELRVQLSGPTAHEFTLPPCPECPPNYANEEDACPTFDGRPSITLRLGPGTFYELATYPTRPSVESFAGETEVLSGYVHTNCLFVRQPSLSPRAVPIRPPG